jgi:hypothetical protein
LSDFGFGLYGGCLFSRRFRRDVFALDAQSSSFEVILCYVSRVSYDCWGNSQDSASYNVGTRGCYSTPRLERGSGSTLLRMEGVYGISVQPRPGPDIGIAHLRRTDHELVSVHCFYYPARSSPLGKSKRR